MDARTPEKLVSPLGHAEIRVIIIGVMLAMFLSALDQTIIATALPTIGAQFGDLENMTWVVTAYLVTGTAVTPLVGKLADIHGPRMVLLGSIALFLVGSVACALAPNMTALIVARAVQGLGGGGLIALAQTIIGILIAPRDRGRYQGYFAAVFITSSVAGPVLGGFFAERLHWSLIFWINVPLGLLAALMSNRVLKRLPAHHHPHRLDLLGAFLMCAATVALLLALSWGGIRFGWFSIPILGLLALSLLLWVGFGLRVATAMEPLVPITLFYNPVVRTGVPAAAFAMGTLVGLSIQMPLYLEGVVGLTASEAGLALIPLMGSVVIGATGAGKVMSHVRRYKVLPMLGLTLAVIAQAIMAALPFSVPLWVILLLMGLTGFGLGTVFPVATVAVQNAVPMPQMGTVTGVVNFFRSLGSAVLVAIFGAIVIGFSGIAAEDILAHLLQGSAQIDALAEAFRWVFVAAGLSLALSLIALVAMEERPLRAAPTPGALAD